MSKLFALLVLTILSIPTLALDYEFQTSGKIVAIGDINGSYRELVSLLTEIELIDSSENWIGGTTRLVSLGNIVGSPDDDEILSLLMKLEEQSSNAGGNLHIVLGEADVAAFTNSSTMSNTARSWLQQKPVIIKINDNAYSHGGIADSLAEETLISINEIARGEIATSSILENEDSPIQYRGTAMCHPYSEAFNTERFLKRNGARHLITGHVPTDGRVTSRMNGMVILLDTGMAEGGRPAAFIEEGSGNSYVHYLGSDKKAAIIPETRELSPLLSSLDDHNVELLLSKAQITSVREIGTGITNPWRVEQMHNGMEHSAVFKYVDTDPGMETKKYYNSRQGNESDRYRFEVAAYKLDRMLDLQLVPVAVVANIKGKEGVLQDWINDAINERDRLEAGAPFDGPCAQHEQYRLRIVFDILIYNEDRNLTNIIWSKDKLMMRFIDHTRAFRSQKNRPHQYRKVKIRLSDLLKHKLELLNTESLTEELGEYLHPKQIQSLLARRDLLLKQTEPTGDW